jgi:hypothetical protein
MRASCALLENFSCTSLRNEKAFPQTPSQKNFEAAALNKKVSAPDIKPANSKLKT